MNGIDPLHVFRKLAEAHDIVALVETHSSVERILAYASRFSTTHRHYFVHSSHHTSGSSLSISLNFLEVFGNNFGAHSLDFEGRLIHFWADAVLGSLDVFVPYFDTNSSAEDHENY